MPLYLFTLLFNIKRKNSHVIHDFQRFIQNRVQQSDDNIIKIIKDSVHKIIFRFLKFYCSLLEKIYMILNQDKRYKDAVQMVHNLNFNFCVLCSPITNCHEMTNRMPKYGCDVMSIERNCRSSWPKNTIFALSNAYNVIRFHVKQHFYYWTLASTEVSLVTLFQYINIKTFYFLFLFFTSSLLMTHTVQK